MRLEWSSAFSPWMALALEEASMFACRLPLGEMGVFA